MTPPDDQSSTDEVIYYNNDIEDQYLISETMFLWLCVVSFGFYQVWWTYKVYRFFDQKEGKTSNSAIRATFNIFFLIPLLYKIQRFAKEEGYAYTFYPIPLYILFFSFSLLGLLPLSFFFFLSYLSCLFLIQPLKAFNFAIEQSAAIRFHYPAGLNTRQLLLVIIGCTVWFLLLAGVLLVFIGYKQQG